MPTTLETGSLTVPDRESIANPFKDYFASIWLKSCHCNSCG